MKVTLKTSAALNLLLAGGLIFVYLNPRKPVAPAPLEELPKLQEPAPPTETLTTPQVARPAEVENNPFRWSRLVDTNNYRGFVANLRKAGCPEATVEDIVRGDIGRIFDLKRSESHTDGNGPWSAQSQMELVAYILGKRFPSTAIASAKTAPEPQPAAVADATPQPQTAAPALTAFLQNVDLTDPRMNEEQKQQIAALRRNLLAQITQLNSTPGGLGGPAVQPGSEDAPLPAAQSDVTQIGNSVAQSGVGKNQFWHPLPQSTLVDIEAESLVGGMFGSSSAMQYQQQQAAQAGQQVQQ